MRLFGLLLLAAALTSRRGAARAHPHVWITATSELLYAADGSITGVRHAWTFDDMFSAYALQGLQSQDQGRLYAARSWRRWRRPMSSR